MTNTLSMEIIQQITSKKTFMAQLIDAVREESEPGYQMLFEICQSVKQLDLDKTEFAQQLADYNIFETFEVFLSKK